MSSTDTKTRARWGKAKVQAYNDPKTTPGKYPNGDFIAIVRGRDRWALECLKAASAKGCTPIDTPGPRWSAYVNKLRDAGFHIETITETHEGAFAGTHARYVLHSTVTISDLRGSE